MTLLKDYGHFACYFQSGLLDDLTEEGAQSWYFELFLPVQNYLKIEGNLKNSSLLKIEKH